eukprot:4913980-Prymnesium_polylepis.1
MTFETPTRAWVGRVRVLCEIASYPLPPYLVHDLPESSGPPILLPQPHTSTRNGSFIQNGQRRHVTHNRAAHSARGAAISN